MVRTVENCRVEDGLTVRRLRHFKCVSCGARFFDDDAVHRIQTERKKTSPRPPRLSKPRVQAGAPSGASGTNQG